MIVVAAKLFSSRGRHEDENLGKLTITNDGTGTRTRGNYDIVLYSRGGKSSRKVREARIEDWPRNSKTAWDLVTAAVEAVKANKG